MQVGDIPYGYCHCGCGQKTTVSPRTDARLGYIKGEPVPYRLGHCNRGRVYRPVDERFWEKVDKDGCVPEHAPHLGHCWIWTGARNDRGYGQIRVSAEQPKAYAHRWSYESAVGPIPSGLEIDHLCRNRACVRPTHLEAVTHRENLIRGTGPVAVNAAKTHCDRGHELAPENIWLTTGGKRQCRECHRLTRRERRTRAAGR